MGGKSGIQIIDDVNPLNDEGAVGSQVTALGNNLNSFTSSFGNEVNNSLTEHKDFYLTAAAIAAAIFTFGGSTAVTGAGAAGSSAAGAGAGSAAAGSGAAASAGGFAATEAASTSYLFGSSAASSTVGGASYLGAETTLGSYLGAETAFGSAAAMTAETGYLGVNTSLASTAVAESTPWWSTAASKAADIGLDVGKSVLVSKLLGGGGGGAQPVSVARQPSGAMDFSQFVPGRETNTGGAGVSKANMGNLAAIAGVGLLSILVIKRFMK